MKGMVGRNKLIDVGEILKWLPGVFFRTITSPSHLILEMFAMPTRVEDFFNFMFQGVYVTFNSEDRRWRFRDNLRREERGNIGFQEGLMEDRMNPSKAPVMRKVELVRGSADFLNDFEGTVATMFQFLRRAFCWIVFGIEPDTIAFFIGN